MLKLKNQYVLKHSQLDPRLYYCFTRSEICQVPLKFLSLPNHRDRSVKYTSHRFRYIDSSPRTHTHAHSDTKRSAILRSHYGRRGIINQYRYC